jgi:hypothetical protein
MNAVNAVKPYNRITPALFVALIALLKLSKPRQLPRKNKKNKNK